MCDGFRRRRHDHGCPGVSRMNLTNWSGKEWLDPRLVKEGRLDELRRPKHFDVYEVVDEWEATGEIVDAKWVDTSHCFRHGPSPSPSSSRDGVAGVPHRTNCNAPGACHVFHGGRCWSMPRQQSCATMFQYWRSIGCGRLLCLRLMASLSRQCMMSESSAVHTRHFSPVCMCCCADDWCACADV